MTIKESLLWSVSLLITLSFAVFQRMTGPTNPLRVSAAVPGSLISVRLLRSCETGEACRVIEPRSAGGLQGRLHWRLYPGGGRWESEDFFCVGEVCSAAIPSQPPAGKVEYHIDVRSSGGNVLLGPESVVARFKGAVPPAVLVPHIVLMFLFMLFAVRAFLSALSGTSALRGLHIAAVGSLLLGGFVLGPLTQYYAFGQAWTGFPFGRDLTDNKTLVILLCWIPVFWRDLGARALRAWTIAAFIVTAAVYLVPHSLHGSQFDYAKREVVTGR